MLSAIAYPEHDFPPRHGAGSDLPEIFAQVVRRRRSVYAYVDRSVPRIAIERAIHLAMLAPNHYRTKPWRFAVFAEGGRKRLASAYAAAALRLGRDAARYSKRAFDAPVMIVVGCVPCLDQPKVRLGEEGFAVAAAVQTMLLALAASGISSLIATGDIVESEEVGALVGIPRETGSVVAVVSAGYANPERPPAKRPEPDAAHSSWCEEA